jgi:hypothetical protein
MISGQALKNSFTGNAVSQAKEVFLPLKYIALTKIDKIECAGQSSSSSLVQRYNDLVHGEK